MRANYALSAYPLSLAFQNQLKDKLNAPVEFLLLGELRQKPLKELWRFMRTLKPEHFLLPLEDKNSHVLLPVLKIFAKVALPKKMVVVHHDLDFQEISTLGILTSFGTFLKASFQSGREFWLSRKQISQLLQSPVIPVTAQAKTDNHVLYLNANLWFGVKAGGSVGHIAGVINALDEKGFQVDYASVDASGMLAPSVSHLKIPAPAAFGIPSELNYYRFNRHAADFLSTHCGAKHWKYIYQRLSIANYTGVLLSRRHQIPLIIEYNGSEAWVAKNWGRPLKYHETAIQAEEVCLKHAQVIVTISQVLKEELIERGIPEAKIVCYPNCIDPHLFSPENHTKQAIAHLRQKHGIAEDAMVCTFVGTFGQWHGVDMLAKTIRYLIETDKAWLDASKTRFLLVGDGGKMAEVKTILDEYLHSEYVTLTGLVPQKEAPLYLASSDILLSPHIDNTDGSRFFGSPTKLFEYMAMEKAIIASKVEQIGEVIQPALQAQDGLTGKSVMDETGILFESGNVEAFANAIRWTVENREAQIQLGKNARQKALACYTWGHHVDAILDGIRRNVFDAG